MYNWIPFEIERIIAIPIIPMLPANAVRIVLVFLVIRLLKESESAVKNDIDVFCFFPDFLFFFSDALTLTASLALISASISSNEYGSESSVITPSNNLTILVE